VIQGRVTVLLLKTANSNQISHQECMSNPPMRRLAIIIPVKPLHQGKSRLADVLRPEARYGLNRELMVHTFGCAAALRDIAAVHVVSRSQEVLAEAERRDFSTCIEACDAGLNAALSLAADQAAGMGADKVIVLPVDLPRLSAAALRSLVDEFEMGPDVLIVTDRLQDGTNILMWRPLARAMFLYGFGSARRHSEAAAAQLLSVRLRQDVELSLDLDTLDDLMIWRQDRSRFPPPSDDIRHSGPAKRLRDGRPTRV